MELPKIVLFDLDGTLLDNSTIVVDAYYTGLKELGYPNPDRNKIAAQAGKNTFDTGRSLGVKDDDLSALDRWFWQYFREYCETTTGPIAVMDDVDEVLAHLEQLGITIGVVTSNTAANAELLLGKAELDHYFTTIVGKENTNKHKPHPDPIYFALDQLEYQGSSVWFIGDSASDVKAAQYAEIKSIAIPQDHSKEAVIGAEPDLLVGSMTDLLSYLHSL